MAGREEEKGMSREEIVDLLHEITSELKAAGDFGKFEEEEDNEGVYPEILAIRIIKEVAKRHNIHL